MKKEEKYFKRIDENVINIKNKTVLLNGATGGIGSSLATYLSYLNNDLYLLVRNTNEGDKLKEKLERKFHNKIRVIHFDYLDEKSIQDTIDLVKNIANIDYFVNVSGIYHQKYELIDKIEKTYLVNYFRPSYLISEILKIKPQTKIIVVSSLTSTTKLKKKKTLLLDTNSFITTLNNIKNKTKRYAVSKHLLSSYLLYLKETSNSNITLSHPGVAVTKLFDKKNKAYNKLFYIFVPSIMKLIFMDSAKASLSILKALDCDYTPLKSRIGPRGLFHSWGYPKIYNLKKNLLNLDENREIYNLTNAINSK